MRGLLTALSFLTRVPLPARAVARPDFGAALAFFPLVGLLLGAMTLALALLSAGRVPSGLTAVMLLSLSALVTGALHLDGLADTFDAAGGGRGDPARMLSIMADSRIGAHGAVALCLLLAAKIFALQALLDAEHYAPLLLAPAVARGCVVPLIRWLPYARPGGLGAQFRRAGRGWHAALALAWLVGAIYLLGGVSLGAILWPAGLVGGLALWSVRRIGGLTGDVYGAAIELAELSVWVAAA